MSDFLTRLVQRQLGAIRTVEPRLPEVYAPFSSIEPSLVDAPTTEFTAPAVPAPPRPLLASASVEMNAAPQPPVRQPERTLNTKVAPQAETMSAQKSAPNPIAAAVSLETTRLVMPESSEPGRNIQTASIARADNLQRESPPMVQLSHAADETGVPVTPPPTFVATAATLSVGAPPRLAASRDGVAPGQTRRQQATTEPPVHVTIGRIEVTALTQAAPAKRVSVPRKPSMSLEDYLARRQRGER